MTENLKLIECQGTPIQMGLQYGEQAREEIQKDLSLRLNEIDKEKLKHFANKAKLAISKFLPDELEELKGIAKGANVSFDHVLFANHVDTFGSTVERCTPVLLRESPEGTIVAKNNDAPVNEEYPFIIRKGKPAKGLPFIQVTYAGWLSGLDMMNAEGLANTHGSVGSVFDKSGLRIDIRLYVYSLMKTCKSTDEFVRKLNILPLTGKGFNIAMGDKYGETVMLDAAVPFVAVRNRNKQFDYATNIYNSPGLENADMRNPAKRDICLYRYGYLKWRETSNPPEQLKDIKDLLSSHDSWAPCRHGGAHNSKTTWSMISMCNSGKVLIAHGNPCQNEYKEYNV
jgi:predicted choloylglycine hydrolase